MHFNFSIPRLFKLLFKQMNISEMKKQSKNSVAAVSFVMQLQKAA